MTETPVFPAASERAIVVGAGITGLTAAFRLRQRGFDVTVLESDESVGGKMSSVRRDGYTINRAANILPASYSALKSLIRDVGIGAEQIGEMPATLGVPRGGRMHRIRSSGARMLADGATTKLLSVHSKAKLVNLLVDAVRMKSSLSYENLGAAAKFDTETVAGYCARRLDPDIREYLVEPLLRALFTSNADSVSVVDFFFAAVNFVGVGLLRYPAGIDFLVNALVAHLDVRTRARVHNIEATRDGVQVNWTGLDGEHAERAAACVVAVSGALVPPLYPQLDPVRRDILAGKLRYCTTYAAHFALAHRPDEQALVVPVPRGFDENLCVVTFDHNSSPDCVPPGAGLVSSYWLHEWSAARAGCNDREVIAEMIPAMAKIVPGVADDLVFAHLDRWDPAVVRSYPGWYSHVDTLVRRTDPEERVQLAGDYLSASSTNACVVSAEVAARNAERAVFRTDTLAVG